MAQITASGGRSAEDTAFAVLAALSFCHLLNDMMQSLLPAIYPVLKDSHGLTFAEIGLITLVNQLTASLLQPVVGMYTDRRPRPFSLAVGMGFTLAGLALLGYAGSFAALLVAAAFVGLGSAVFHPESSRIARLASGGRHGFAQSLFQVGGAVGASVGPLIAAFVVLANGQASVAWFSAVALLGMAVLWQIGLWYRTHHVAKPKPQGHHAAAGAGLSRRRVAVAMAILLALMFSKFFYLSSLTNYYTFYLIDRFDVGVQSAQIHLFVFLGASALGTFIGGPVGDRIGRKYVIWISILGVAPFTLALPHLDLVWTAVFSVAIGVVISSAFSAIVVYGQELMPGNVGTVAGLFFGVAFGLAGLGAAALGHLADLTSIEFVYRICAWLPLIGLLTAFLPDLGPARLRLKDARAGGT